MEKSFRIGMLTARFYPYQGGAEIQCLRLSAKLTELHHSVLILTQKMPHTARFELIKGFPVYRLGLPIKNILGSFFYFFAALKTILKQYAKIDLLHAHIASTPAVVASLITKFTGKPSLVKFAGSRKTGDIATSLRSPHGNFKLGFIKRNASAFVCPSAEIAEELFKHGFDRERVYVIANGVETSVFSPAGIAVKSALRQQLGLPARAKIALYAGRLEKGKGLETLIEAWKAPAIAAAGPAAVLVIAGAGTLLKKLKTSAEGAKNIIFAGWQDDISSYLKASDIFVLPSSGEGMPNSLLEAMACGLGCVGTDIGGIRELISNRSSGLLFEPGNAPALAEAIARFLTDEKLLSDCGTNARETILKAYSIERVTEAYVGLYGKLLERAGTKGRIE